MTNDRPYDTDHLSNRRRKIGEKRTRRTGTQTDDEGGNVTIQSHLDDLISFSPSNDLNMREHQPNPFDIFLEGERMDSEGETYLSYEEMSPGELDSYYFRLD